MRDPEETDVSKAHTASSVKQSTLLGVLILTSGALRSFATSLNIYQSTRRYIPSRFESSRAKPTSHSPLLQHRSSAKISRPASQKFNRTAVLTTAQTQVTDYASTLLIHLLSSSATRNKPDYKIFTSCVYVHSIVARIYLSPLSTFHIPHYRLSVALHAIQWRNGKDIQRTFNYPWADYPAYVLSVNDRKLLFTNDGSGE